MRARPLILALLLMLGIAAPVAAHEVRPAYLEITERADGRADVLWKQPSIGLMAVALRPHIAGGLIDRAPDEIADAESFQIARWHNLDLHGQGLGGREVRIDGLDIEPSARQRTTFAAPCTCMPDASAQPCAESENPLSSLRGLPQKSC